ncbi:hypothetical protein [Mycolicibacterium alvei]|uniref:PE-PPE domain-containing protein n=1 Tax=Mycolicibacterium alvei TaxID=67081 RepID=A0A6N4V1V7_9MYCO|nr:hypothetical protein [Mycolicibacterium alvei]MCV7003742.1 hypothetical protein [Mycolicibacterium alvei]BBX30123.1 hypothetical protein MALV_52480 [Mycolicibacterium alvei]
MFTAVRPCLSAGIALVGASVIAVTPLSPPPAASVVASPVVQLAAIPSPLQLYPQVLETTLANVDAQFEYYFGEPFPIIGATLENYAQAFEDAVTALQSGRSDELFVSVTRIVLQPLRSIVLSTGGLLSAYYLPSHLLKNLFGAAIGPLLNGIAATGLAIADVFEAITTFDVVGLVNAVINIPARIIDGVLNGVPGTSFGSFDNLPGLLTPRFTRPYSSSLITLLIRLDQEMGRAITPIPPFPPSAINTWSGPEVQTMMLTAEPETEPVAVQEQLPTADEAVLDGRGPVTEELDLPTFDVPDDVPGDLPGDLPGDDVPGDGVPEEVALGEDLSEEADDLVKEEPALAPEQALTDTELTDDEPSSPAPTDEAKDPGSETNG